MQALERVFAADGTLAAGIPGFKLRAQQVEMAWASRLLNG